VVVVVGGAVVVVVVGGAVVVVVEVVVVDVVVVVVGLSSTTLRPEILGLLRPATWVSTTSMPSDVVTSKLLTVPRLAPASAKMS
jgi:hypothetical protein